eukprot:1935241-Rhodomonas_salina.4
MSRQEDASGSEEGGRVGEREGGGGGGGGSGGGQEGKGAEAGEAYDMLQRLANIGLLGRMWPPDRWLLGMRTCRYVISSSFVHRLRPQSPLSSFCSVIVITSRKVFHGWHYFHLSESQCAVRQVVAVRLAFAHGRLSFMPLCAPGNVRANTAFGATRTQLCLSSHATSQLQSKCQVSSAGKLKTKITFAVQLAKVMRVCVFGVAVYAS